MPKKILMIDDSATARMLFKVFVQQNDDIILFEAGHWKEALKTASEEALDLIIFDYNMPEKSGTELAALMREQDIEAAFALISANTQQHVLEEVEALKFIDVLEKPISAEAIQKLLEKIS